MNGWNGAASVHRATTEAAEGGKPMALVDDDTDENLEAAAPLHREELRPPEESRHPAHGHHAVHVHRLVSHVLRVKPGVERSRVEQSFARALGMKLAEFREAVRARETRHTPRPPRRAFRVRGEG